MAHNEVRVGPHVVAELCDDETHGKLWRVVGIGLQMHTAAADGASTHPHWKYRNLAFFTELELEPVTAH